MNSSTSLSVASRSLVLVLRRPLAATLFCVLLLSLEVIAALVLERTLQRVLMHISAGASPLTLVLGGGALIAGLTLLFGAGGVALLTLLPTENSGHSQRGLDRAREVSVHLLALLLALAAAGVSLIAALSILPRLILRGDLWGIAPLLMFSLPAVALASLTAAATSLALARTLTGRAPASPTLRGLGSLGSALNELLVAPGRALSTIGLQTLLACPLLVGALAAALMTATTPSPLARIALALTHGLCGGLALLWITTGLHLRFQGGRPAKHDPSALP